ncbi:glycosyltransferase [Candidatus Dojkabacteria bacterium CG_4_9_14_3_um_filter_150_Dojkabacteria_WS6_41_13]|uniref:Glycosyltransferase n=1 Tax=Candidatus Dojkabacteria bacterium CG_4_10_14_0_2_um_filter_Dojkabacteria_WS6_41_15 TaxID=2014249 RepID=A0A2M7W1Q6_9BACT|nr:MAG: glycosyltransferase [Candidatus Dojkabacteria bacterium CG_4_10_14_3_um_filter_Dojkabacteria_WS6_41_9]PJA13746.1 MAG: glycosyltransferase [Candidatus Dojkabacteria bacterium CG_4_10_14_0_2_um_filter_Dojkabacteria_WS6_41_15]PJB22543.1 MAG: glycosyltransferase [Candidatus Dojkabacteria bacterium CG_4_9_14_3_um_filter_150_Dojkabacteria_WS6_41_13]
MNLKKISWVLPIFNEEVLIPTLYKELQKLQSKIKEKYETELVFVDDGSKDKSLEMLSLLFEQDKTVKVLAFSRNFGHQMAITAGLDAATGDAVIFMDTDLQDPPSVCLELIEKWEAGYDVAYAKRRSRKDSFLKKFTAYIFYRLLRKFADISIPEDTGDFRLISRQVADTLRQFPERHRFIRGLVSYIGFKQIAVLFDRQERKAGTTGYSLKKMVKLAEDALTGFSLAPIMIVGVSGTLLAIVGGAGVIVGLFAQNLTLVALSYATILTGIILIALSTIGQYIGRTYQQVQGRPLYIVKSKLEHN